MLTHQMLFTYTYCITISHFLVNTESDCSIWQCRTSTESNQCVLAAIKSSRPPLVDWTHVASPYSSYTNVTVNSSVTTIPSHRRLYSGRSQKQLSLFSLWWEYYSDEDNYMQLGDSFTYKTPNVVTISPASYNVLRHVYFTHPNML